MIHRLPVLAVGAHNCSMSSFDVHSLGAYIRSQRQHARLSLRELARRAGVSNPYLSQLERGLRRPSAEMLQRLAAALELSAETLYVRAGLLDDRGGAADVVAAIAGDLTLTEHQRAALLETYREFQTLNAALRTVGTPQAPTQEREASE